jgi:superfamily II DNA or RNA helicase
VRRVTAVRVDGTRARVVFDRFDQPAYELFLRAKTLPESDIAYDEGTGVYTLSTDARFASLLDASLEPVVRKDAPLAEHLFDYQAFIVGQALAARRYAIWADTGLGKTAMFLEWARQVRDRTGRRVLILSPLQVIEQTRAEWQRFYGSYVAPWIPLERIDSREALVEWCEQPGPAIGITNYEKLIAGVLPELRRLGGIVADESSILKTGGGTIKWNLIKSARGVEFKVSCTATPAPNEPMEYASQAAFLEKLRSEGEILWTFFQRNSAGVWQVKPHAREAFYRFMSSWSIYLRDPARFGFADILASLPDPVMHEHRLEMTEEQRALADELRVASGRGLFDERIGIRERSKFAQIARGFVYEASGPGRAVRRVSSVKPQHVAALAVDEVRAGRPTIVWTSFDAEGEIIVRELSAEAALTVGSVALLTGDTPDAERQRIIDDFRAGVVQILVTKPSLVGYGLNFQHCRAMVLSGIDDSFERMYQAIRRAYRYGQTETVHVHVPVIPELEGLMLENLARKQAAFDSDTAEQERWYRAALFPALDVLKEAA